MLTYAFEVKPHYSGHLCGHFPDIPCLFVLAGDHEELEELALAALEVELARRVADGRPFPRPGARGPCTISTPSFPMPAGCDSGRYIPA